MRKYVKAFTLIELMVVVAIIAILAAIAIPAYEQYKNENSAVQFEQRPADGVYDFSNEWGSESTPAPNGECVELNGRTYCPQ